MNGLLPTVAKRLPRKLFVRLVAYQYRLFEPELRELAHFVPKDKVAVDVGTWWGPWSWWLSRRVPRVESFEPNQSICQDLRHALPDNVTLHNLALSDESGLAVLWSPGATFGTEGRSKLAADGYPGWLGQQVKTASLDDFDFSDVGFVKIDVEGHELEVLRGAAHLLARERPNVLVEIEQAHQSAGHVDEVFEFMADAGYRGTFLKDGRWHPLDDLDREDERLTGETRKSLGLLQATLARDGYVNNFVFVPRDDPRPLRLAVSEEHEQGARQEWPRTDSRPPEVSDTARGGARAPQLERDDVKGHQKSGASVGAVRRRGG